MWHYNLMMERPQMPNVLASWPQVNLKPSVRLILTITFPYLPLFFTLFLLSFCLFSFPLSSLLSPGLEKTINTNFLKYSGCHHTVEQWFRTRLGTIKWFHLPGKSWEGFSKGSLSIWSKASSLVPKIRTTKPKTNTHLLNRSPLFFVHTTNRSCIGRCHVCPSTEHS